MTQKDKSLSISTLLVLALTAVVPLIVATGFSNFERPRQLVLAVLAGLALIAWGVGLVRRGHAQVASPQTVVLGGAFAGCVTLSLLWTGVVEFGALSVITWLGLGAVFLVLAAPIGRVPRFLDWVTAVAAGAIGAGGLGLYELFGGQGLVPVWDPAGVTGGFDAMAFAAAYYLVAIPLLVGAVAMTRGLRRWFMGLALVLAAIHLALVVDALALGVLAAAMVVVALVMRIVGDGEIGQSSKFALGAAGLVVVVAVGALAFLERPDEPSVADDLPRVSQSAQFEVEMARQARSTWWYFAADRMESPTDQRFRSYLNSVSRGMWQNEPIIGHGAGGWWLMQTDVVDRSDPHTEAMFERYAAFKSPHSDYSRILVEQGALGLLLFVLWLIGIATAIGGSIRAKKLSDDDDALVMWALTTSFGVGVMAMAFMPLLELVSSGVVWVGAAAMAVGYAVRRTESGGWLSTYEFGKKRGWMRIGVAAALLVVAVAMIIPAVLHAKSALERGYADHLMLRSQFDEAISWYEKAHQSYPAHAENLYNQAIAHRITGSTVEGSEAIDEAIEMRPHDARLRAHATHIELAENRVRPAVEHAAEAVRTGPVFLEAYEVYAAALQRRGRYHDTGAVFEAVLELEPPTAKRSVLRVQYATLLADYLDRLEDAHEQLQLAVEDSPAGAERALLVDQVEELENRIERRRLQEEGRPVPPELQPEVEAHDHDHGGPFDPHGHGDDHDDVPGNPFPFDPQDL